MSSSWFETVAVAQARAQKLLPPSVYGAIVAGAEAGVSIKDNTTAFDELGIRPLTAGQTTGADLATTIMGRPSSFPVMISPTGVQAVHPDGEVAVARAAAARGIPMGLSSFASKPIEQVAETGVDLFFQIYWAGSRDDILRRVKRAKDAGALGLILTLDWSFSHGRDWGSPDIPQRMDLKTALRHAYPALRHPVWLARWLKTKAIPPLTVPNFGEADADPVGFFDAYGAWMGTPPPTWEDVAWLASQWDGPFMVKGIGRADEARRAVQAGATAISVSNHGGNNVDGAPAPIRVLAEISDAVGGDCEVLMDGGIRRGSDVVKAVAMGASAVLIGRAYLWGLAVNGQAGVENVIDVLNGGMQATMRSIAKTDLASLSRNDLVIPHGFSPTPMLDLPPEATR